MYALIREGVGIIGIGHNLTAAKLDSRKRGYLNNPEKLITVKGRYPDKPIIGDYYLIPCDDELKELNFLYCLDFHIDMDYNRVILN